MREAGLVLFGILIGLALGWGIFRQHHLADEKPWWERLTKEAKAEQLRRWREAGKRRNPDA